ncbi:conserved hypothetical protein [Tenacibaculum sp. 190524A02b]|uniref:Lipoprotein n=1 Tax=Tenacibaculum vairaonense TaxID=3137860 RepID=A0ABM9PM23_9FLAO
MKKVTLILGIIIGMLALNSCTDNTEEILNNKNQIEVIDNAKQFIDKDKTRNPGDDGDEEDESND